MVFSSHDSAPSVIWGGVNCSSKAMAAALRITVTLYILHKNPDGSPPPNPARCKLDIV